MKKSPVYQSCSELPLHNFIKIVVKNELKYMLVNTSDDYSESIITEAWEKIFDEYCQITGSSTNKQALSLSRDGALLSSKLDLVQQVLAFIELNGPSEPLFDVLRDCGFRYSFSEETLKSDIQRVISKCKLMIIELKEVSGDLDKLSKNNKNVEVSEKAWYSNIASVSRFMGFSIDPKSTSVMQFASYTDTFIKMNTKNPLKNAK